MCWSSSLASSQLVMAALAVTATQPADEKIVQASTPAIVGSMTSTTACMRQEKLFRLSGSGKPAGLSWTGVLYAHEAALLPVRMSAMCHVPFAILASVRC